MAILSMFSGGGSATSVPLEAPTDFLAEARNNKIALTWTDPPNETTTPSGITVATWKYTRIVRKTGSYPTSPNDGVLVVESSVRDQYKTTPFEDGNLENGTLYYYAAYAYNDNNVASDAATIAAAPTAGDVFGVQWDMSNSSTALLRLTPSNDPNHYVNHVIDTEPSPATSTSSGGSSPFDEFYPWKGMEEYNIVNNQVKYKSGDSRFSRKNYDTMVWVPEFYYHIEQEGDVIRYYVASSPRDNFEKHPGSGVFVSRYFAIQLSSVIYFRSGYSPITQSLTNFTSKVKSKGPNWRPRDYVTLCAINLLYLVEFSDFDVQRKIGIGLGSDFDNDPRATGQTDSLTYHTGRIGDSIVSYRHIENLWANMGEYISGITMAYPGQVWVCTNPQLYEIGATDGYVNIGTLPSKSGYITRMDVSEGAPWAMIPTEVGGSSSTYVSDYMSSVSSGKTVLRSGAAPSNDPSYEPGLWYFSSREGEADRFIGFRAIFDKPSDWEPEVA